MSFTGPTDNSETLKQVYDRILAGLTGLESLTPTDAKAELNTLVQLLEEGKYHVKHAPSCILIDSAGLLDRHIPHRANHPSCRNTRYNPRIRSKADSR